MKGEFICKANRITETHPLASQMGDIKDIEDYKQKIEIFVTKSGAENVADIAKSRAEKCIW